MAVGKVGDRVLVESERVGQPAREGQILEVLGTATTVHYRVRWQDGHESTFFPDAGSMTVIEMAAGRRPSGAARGRVTRS